MPSTKAATGSHMGEIKSPTFGLKSHSIHQDMAKAYTNITENPAEVPEWLVEGLTYLLPKTRENKNPYHTPTDNVQNLHIHYDRKDIHLLK